MTPRLLSASVAAALLLSLTACAATEAEPESPTTSSDPAEEVATEPVAEEPTSGSDSASGSDSSAASASGTGAELEWTDISSCADVGAPIAQYTDGLTMVGDYVDEYGIVCVWEEPNPSSGQDVRSVSVTLNENTYVLSKEDVELTGIFTVHPDAAIDGAGGVAYSLVEDTGAGEMTTTFVSVPGIDLSISTFSFNDLPALTDEAAVTAAKQILGY